MATTNQCVASLMRLNLSSTIRPTTTTIPRFLAPSSTSQIRWKSAGTRVMQAREREKEKLKKKKKQHRFKEYKYATPSQAERFSLMDAMRYLRAAEVGRPPSSVTYEVALKIRTIKNGPVIRDRIRLPFPVKTDVRIAVICKDGTSAMHDARTGGAVAYGEETLFEMIKANPNNLPFNRLICHAESETALKKAGLGRILGPKGLMPSLKTNTITRSVGKLMKEMVGAENYRERIGAVRMPIGNILFSPKQLGDNIRTLIDSIKGRIQMLEDRVRKEVVEVVLSSTNGPGFPLNGTVASIDERLTSGHLSTTM